MIDRYQTPTSERLAGELFAFWEEIFGSEDPDIPIGVFLGDEAAHNQHVVLVERDSDTLAGTCGIMTPRANPEFAGIGEVATRPEYRGRGIANRLCQEALAEFRDNGGEAAFLGTENPGAARIYHRLGWRRISNSTVYANITSGESPEEYLADYFRNPSPVNIMSGDASLRVSMIPLLLTPHDWQVLDGNLPTPMISTRYAEQNSCMGLCRKYYYLIKPSPSQGEIQRGSIRAEWFAAKTDDGRLVGISTARIDEGRVCYVDGFIHARFGDAYGDLIGAATEWGSRQDAAEIVARVCVEDEEKQARFEEMGFRSGTQDGTFKVGDREVPALIMSLY